LRIKVIKGSQVQPNALYAVHAKSGLPSILTDPLPMATLIINLRQAKARAKVRRSNHSELRPSYREQLATSIAEHKHPFLITEGDSEALATKAATALQNLVKREQKQRAFRRIGNVLDPTSSTRSGLAKIDVPAGDTRPYPEGPDPKTWDGPWTLITTPDDIAAHICSENNRQYDQAKSTTFASGSTSTSPGSTW
jgi:hypothetical protein